MQDGQVQTTNRGLLLDYVNRTSMRILRESQWTFLRSDPQRFITEPGAGRYWLNSGNAPAGCVDTNLNLTDMASVIPDSVFDLTNQRQLLQDSSSVLNRDSFHFKDGNARTGIPRAFSYEITNPGIFNLTSPADNQNLYYPVPGGALCGYISGGALFNRTYYVVTSYVDSFGGEGTASTVPTNIAVPAAALLLVKSPDPEVPSASTIIYSRFNVYIGTSFAGPFYLQNTIPIPIGSDWMEPVQGVSTSSITPAASFPLTDSLGNIWSVGVSPGGILQTTSLNTGANPLQFFITDSLNTSWLVQVNTLGNLVTVAGMGSPLASIQLIDSTNNVWQISIDNMGMLVTSPLGPVSGVVIPTRSPLQSPTIAPLYGYVIGFRYQKQRVQIASPNQLLQIPYQYYDVVVAGVNFYANMYTSKADDLGVKVGTWKREFMDGLAQIRRDLRINFRNADFISPDRITQVSTDPVNNYYGIL